MISSGARGLSRPGRRHPAADPHLQRKGIEHAIELTRRLGIPATLVISHASGDEGDEYEQRVREYARLLDVHVRFEAHQVNAVRGITPDGRRRYVLADVYPHADLVTYGSSIEGFGRFEAVYFGVRSS
jgi:hypothetical protein